MPLMLRPLARIIAGMVVEPAATITTFLYYSDLLPRSLNLEGLVHRELIQRENYLFRFVIGMLRCFW
ncbi:hypothetical protein NMG60_11005001 [Bertholletia excelsa]